jgi:hypothetical protein
MIGCNRFGDPVVDGTHLSVSHNARPIDWTT